MSLLSGIKAGLGALGSAFGISAPKVNLQVPGFSLPSLPQIQHGISGGLNVGGYTIGGEVGKRTQTSFYAQGSATGTNPSAQGCPRGYHLNKHPLAPSKRHGAVPARSVCVRNRHMNPLNHRADARALRRLKRADKMTRKIHRLFHHTTRKAVGRKR